MVCNYGIKKGRLLFCGAALDIMRKRCLNRGETMKRIGKWVLVLCLLVVLLFGALLVVFGFMPEGSTAVVDRAVQGEDVMDEEAPVVALDVGVVADADGALVFDVSPEDFIASYNGYYWQAEGERYLQPLDMWQQVSVEESVMSPHPAMKYSYRANEDTWTLPVVNVYVPEDGASISEVDLNYDEHSFSSATYALFEKDCFYTLKTFFPDLGDGTLQEVVESVNQSAYDHTFPSTQQYRPGTAQLPPLVYHRDGVGVFGYFAIGAPVHFCVIPVDDALLENYAASGVEVREIA